MPTTATQRMAAHDSFPVRPAKAPEGESHEGRYYHIGLAAYWREERGGGVQTRGARYSQTVPEARTLLSATMAAYAARRLVSPVPPQSSWDGSGDRNKMDGRVESPWLREGS